MSKRKKIIPIESDGSHRKQREFFEEIYKENFDSLFAYGLIITKSESLAKDAVSEVFFNLWKAKTDLFSIKELKSYLFTSVKNQAVRILSNDPVHFHSNKYAQVTASIDNVNPEELLVGKELDEFINDVIEKLPPQCALVFRMVKEDRMKYGEVAAELDISMDTVKYHIKTALKKLRVELENHYPDTKIIDWVSTGSITLVLAKFSLLYFQ